MAARLEGLTRERYREAVDRGRELVLAHVVRGAIHAQAPDDLALFGRALVARDDGELGQQLGRQVQHLAAAEGFAPTDALDQVAEATKDALSGGRALGKNELHEELRERVGAHLMPWCKGCKSHHVAPMLWRYASVKAGARLDSERRYVLGRPGRAPAASQAVRRFLHFYGPATSGDFADWAGLARSHAERLWQDVEGDLDEVLVGRRSAWALSDDAAALASPPPAAGIRLIPPGDPYLQKPNRALLAADSRAAQAVVPAGGKPWRGAQGRPARRPVARQGQGRARPRSPSSVSGASPGRISRRRRSASPRCAAPPRRSSSSTEAGYSVTASVAREHEDVRTVLAGVEPEPAGNAGQEARPDPQQVVDSLAQRQLAAVEVAVCDDMTTRRGAGAHQQRSHLADVGDMLPVGTAQARGALVDGVLEMMQLLPELEAPARILKRLPEPLTALCDDERGQALLVLPAHRIPRHLARLDSRHEPDAVSADRHEPCIGRIAPILDGRPIEIWRARSGICRDQELRSVTTDPQAHAAAERT